MVNFLVKNRDSIESKSFAPLPFFVGMVMMSASSSKAQKSKGAEADEEGVSVTESISRLRA